MSEELDIDSVTNALNNGLRYLALLNVGKAFNSEVQILSQHLNLASKLESKSDDIKPTPEMFKKFPAIHGFLLKAQDPQNNESSLFVTRISPGIPFFRGPKEKPISFFAAREELVSALYDNFLTRIGHVRDVIEFQAGEKNCLDAKRFKNSISNLLELRGQDSYAAKFPATSHTQVETVKYITKNREAGGYQQPDYDEFRDPRSRQWGHELGKINDNPIKGESAPTSLVASPSYRF